MGAMITNWLLWGLSEVTYTPIRCSVKLFSSLLPWTLIRSCALTSTFITICHIFTTTKIEAYFERSSPFSVAAYGNSDSNKSCKKSSPSCKLLGGNDMVILADFRANGVSFMSWSFQQKPQLLLSQWRTLMTYCPGTLLLLTPSS